MPRYVLKFSTTQTVLVQQQHRYTFALHNLIFSGCDRISTHLHSRADARAWPGRRYVTGGQLPQARTSHSASSSQRPTVQQKHAPQLQNRKRSWWRSYIAPLLSELKASGLLRQHKYKGFRHTMLMTPKVILIEVFLAWLAVR